VRRENRLAIFAILALNAHPPPRKGTLGALKRIAEVSTALVTGLLLFGVSIPAECSDMAVAAKRADVSASVTFFEDARLDFNHVHHDRDGAATALTRFPFRFVHQLSEFQGHINRTIASVNSKAIEISGARLLDRALGDYSVRAGSVRSAIKSRKSRSNALCMNRPFQSLKSPLCPVRATAGVIPQIVPRFSQFLTTHFGPFNPTLISRYNLPVRESAPGRQTDERSISRIHRRALRNSGTGHRAFSVIGICVAAKFSSEQTRLG
jgi:hypothetical protein